MAATSQPSSLASFFFPVLAAGSQPPGTLAGNPSAAPPGLPLDGNGVPILPHELKDLKDALPIFKAYAMFWLGIILWDTLSTFPVEYRFVWKSNWSILKACYLLNRYWTPIAIFFDVLMINSHVSPSLCTHVARFFPASAMVTILACGSILSIRLYALWERSRTILATLLTLLLAELALMLVGTIRSEAAVVIPPPFVEAVGFHGCLAQQTHGLALLYWAVSLAFETIALTLLVWRIIVLKNRSGSLPILRILLRHGVFYFIIVFVAGVVNIGFFAQPRVAYQAFNAIGALALMSLMASRLVLALHDSKDKLTLSSHTPTPGGSGPRLSSRAPTAHSRPNTARSAPLPKPGPPFTWYPPTPSAVELSNLSGSTLGGESPSVSPARKRGAGANLPRSSTDDDLEKGGLSLHWVELPSRPPPSHTQSATYRHERAVSALDRRGQTTSQLDEDDERPTSWSDRILSRNGSGRNSAPDVPQSASFECGIVVRQETTVTVSGVGEHGELEKDEF
ncbi:hypothetical protein JCM10213_002071 [Rhodosporidiobolus nylandii]